jgi:hypothetical protein
MGDVIYLKDYKKVKSLADLNKRILGPGFNAAEWLNYVDVRTITKQIEDMNNKKEE